eukprot:TRINITY_DN3197_c0_g1_i2.p1 TRINITY_DN3197_c0_g1~~TRINITY_DN3197_c0_g1_i2.p1  ORF type:complete len:481 (+),score=235.00 TRINITY_DN3197_c0_g1_i2:17-1459(+)
MVMCFLGVFFCCYLFILLFFFFFFFFKQKTAYEMLRSLVGSEMCIRDRVSTQSTGESAASNMSTEACTPHPKAARMMGTPRSVSKEDPNRSVKIQAPENYRLFSQISDPFDMFFEAFVPKYKEEHPDLPAAKKKYPVLLGLARTEWDKSLPEEEKMGFNDQFVKMCEAQNVEVVWDQAGKESAPKKESKKRVRESKSDDGEKPKKEKAKRPLSGYFVFMEGFRTTYVPVPGENKLTGVTKAAGAAWKLLSTKQKNKYKEIGIRRFNGEDENVVTSDEEKEEHGGESESEEEETEFDIKKTNKDGEQECTPGKRKAEDAEGAVEASDSKKPKMDGEQLAAAAAAKALEKKKKKEQRAAEKQAKDTEKKAKDAEKTAEREAKAAEKKEQAAAKAAEKAAEKDAKAAEKAEKERLNPKKPKAAFYLFLSDFRTEFKEANPDAEAADVATAGKDRWAEMEAEAKKKYEDQHNEAVALYLSLIHI